MLYFRIFKNNLIELIKHDFNEMKFPLVFLCTLCVKFLQLTGQHATAFEIASRVYRTGWRNGENLGLKVASYYFTEKPHLGRAVVNRSLERLSGPGNTKKFIENPELMLDGIVTVLKKPSFDSIGSVFEKGAVIINYSFYFSVFFKFFDVKRILVRYDLILEPSWAGLCEYNILAYAFFDTPVYVQVYEKRDRTFIERLNTNLIPIEVGPSWFVDHTVFLPPQSSSKADQTKDFDVIMIAAWAEFKRHCAFLKAIKPLVKRKPKLKIAFVGYPVDLSRQDISACAKHYGIEGNIEFFEWVEPHVVTSLICRAKVNVLWSKFEGNNRAIIEGMFCDVPCILRDGHNYGESYDFINSKTGTFSTESTLADDIEFIIENSGNFSPRNYVMEHRNCILATKIMGEAIEKQSRKYSYNWTRNLEVKVNGLHGMKYLKNNDTEFSENYQWLGRQLKGTSSS